MAFDMISARIKSEENCAAARLVSYTFLYTTALTIESDLAKLPHDTEILYLP